MEWGDLKDITGVIAFFISIATMLYAWLTSKSRVNTERLKAVDDRLNRHSTKIDQIEMELKHLPEKDDVTELKLALAKLEGTVGRLDENVIATSHTIKRMEDFLYGKGSK